MRTGTARPLFSLSPLQISDIHQFYTRNVEVHNMDDMDFIMSSISSSRAAHSALRWTSRSTTLAAIIIGPLVTAALSSLLASGGGGSSLSGHRGSLQLH